MGQLLTCRRLLTSGAALTLDTLLRGPERAFAAETAVRTLKPTLKGLVDRDTRLNGGGFAPIAAYRPIVNNVVVMLDWQQLEPAKGDYRPGIALIEKALANAQVHDAFVLLRVMAGGGAPGWLKKQVGSYATGVGRKYDVVYWWKPEVGVAYRNLMTALAERFDAHPRLRAVVISRSMSKFADGVRHYFPPARQGGLTAENDRASFADGIATHAACWKFTRSALSLVPYKAGELGKGYEGELIALMKKHLGVRAILTNNGLAAKDDPPTALLSPYTELYDRMAAQGCTLAFQTKTPTKIAGRDGSTINTIQYCVDRGAAWCELNTAYDADPKNPRENWPATMAAFKAFDDALESNVSEIVSATPGEKSVTLQWTPARAAVGHDVLVGTASAAPTRTLDAGTATRITVGGLAAGVPHYFLVRPRVDNAREGKGARGVSGERTTTPS